MRRIQGKSKHLLGDGPLEKLILTEQAMLDLGGALAKVCDKGAIVFLHGNLGAGKTTMTRGFLRGLGYEGTVKSPTYTIVEPYQFKNKVVYHFDFYRIHDVQELEYIGIQDYFTSDAICLIEWPENGESLLPAADLSCYIQLIDGGREVKFVANSSRGDAILKRLKNEE